MSASHIDVIIVNWNSRDDTLRAVEATLRQAQEYSASISVIVVDNGSNDGTVEALTSRYPAVRVVPLASNRGFTGGVAAGAAVSKGEWIILLNNDAVPEPEWLASYLKAASEAHQDVIAWAGKIIDLSGTLVDFVGGVMTFDGHAFQRRFRKPLAEADEPDHGAEMLFACGGNMMVRREPFIRLGGFDDDYFAYLEDVDFGWRSWIAGWRTVYLPGAIVRHRSSGTSDRLGNFERGVLFEKNALQTVMKNYEDSVLKETGAVIFLTLLHRLHHYVVERHGDASLLTRKPLPETVDNERWMTRVARKFLRRRSTVPVSDDLAVMQFRAMEWFFQNASRIIEKRSVIQATRVRSDEQIFNRFPLHYIPTYPGDDNLMSSSLFALLRPGQPRSLDKRLNDFMDR